MLCAECGADTARTVAVKYIHDRTEDINLCSDCLSQFKDAEFVDEIQLADS